MPFDFPETPASRMELYVAALRGAQKRGDPQCCGTIMNVHRNPEGKKVWAHCAMGIIIRDVFGVELTIKNQHPNLTAMVMQDLVHFNFDQNHIFRMNDREGMTFGAIADTLETVLDPVTV